MDKQEVLDQAKKETLANSELFEQKIKPASEVALMGKPGPKKWSPLDCIEHLNEVGKIYLPRMELALRQFPSQNITASDTYSPGILGSYMARTMKLKSDHRVPFNMKTFNNLKPGGGTKASNDILNEFVRQQETMLELIDKSHAVDLGKIKITSAIGIVLRFKLGDCFQFLINHTQRHLWQAIRGLE